MSTYTEDHLVEQPAIQLMQHELGWDVMNCYGEPTSLAILRRGYEWQELRRSGWEVPGKAEMLKTEMLKRRKAIDGAVEEMGILDDGFWILNGRGRRTEVPRLNPALMKVGANPGIEGSGFPLAVGSSIFKRSP